jgi:hypothetical protein
LLKIDVFFELLKNNGDTMTDTEIRECLEVLTGNPAISQPDLQDIDSHQLFNDIFGFQEIEKNDG